MLIALRVGKESAFITAFKSFWALAWKPLQNHKAARPDSWLVPGPVSSPHVRCLRSRLLSSLHLLFARPNTHNFINLSLLARFSQCLSAFLSLLGSPQSVLRAEYAFPAKPLSAWNGKQWFPRHLARTPAAAAGTRLGVFFPLSCSFGTGCYHNTSKWHKDSSVGNIFCSYSEVKSLALPHPPYIP